MPRVTSLRTTAEQEALLRAEFPAGVEWDADAGDFVIRSATTGKAYRVFTKDDGLFPVVRNVRRDGCVKHGAAEKACQAIGGMFAEWWLYDLIALLLVDGTRKVNPHVVVLQRRGVAPSLKTYAPMTADELNTVRQHMCAIQELHPTMHSMGWFAPGRDTLKRQGTTLDQWLTKQRGVMLEPFHLDAFRLAVRLFEWVPKTKVCREIIGKHTTEDYVGYIPAGVHYAALLHCGFDVRFEDHDPRHPLFNLPAGEKLKALFGCGFPYFQGIERFWRPESPDEQPKY